MIIDLNTAVIGLVLTSLLQLIAAVWWAASLTGRVGSLEHWRDQHDDVLASLASIQAQVKSMEAALAQFTHGRQ